jgi:flagellar basal body-associated protein FliL
VKGKLKIVVPLVLLIALGGVYKFVLAKPGPKEKPKVQGEVYVLPKDFLVNLSDGKFAKLGVGLVFDEGFKPAPAAAEAGAAPPDGYGALTQEPVVRDIVTDVVTDESSSELTSRKGREDIKTKILKRLRAQTDVKVHEVLLTDVAVQ